MVGSKSFLFWIGQAIWLAILVALIACFLNYNARAPIEPTYSGWFDTDPMSFSGFLAVIIGIAYSVLVDRSQTNLLSRWHDAAIIDLQPAVQAKIKNVLWRRLLMWQLIIAGGLVVVMIVGYINFFTFSDLFNEFSIASFVCAFLVGLRLARLVSHGSLGRLIESQNVPFGMTIEHPDRAGGTTKIGIFYFLQASMLIVPVLWLLIWILQIRPSSEYSNWTEHFYYLLIITVFVFILAFLLPMLAFRRVIRKWKRQNTLNAINDVRNELLRLRVITTPTRAQRQRRAEIAQQLDNLINLPDWPVSPTTRNVFVTTFMLPLIANGVIFVANAIFKLT